MVTAYYDNLKTIDLPTSVDATIIARTFSMQAVLDVMHKDYEFVYFDFMMRPQTDGGALFDIALEGLNKAGQYYANFAQPCPKMCDYVSPLYKAATK